MHKVRENIYSYSTHNSRGDWLNTTSWIHVGATGQVQTQISITLLLNWVSVPLQAHCSFSSVFLEISPPLWPQTGGGYWCWCVLLTLHIYTYLLKCSHLNRKRTKEISFKNADLKKRIMNLFKAHVRKWTENSHPQKQKRKRRSENWTTLLYSPGYF